MERHPLDLVSLTAGLIFTAAAAVGLSGALTLTAGDLRWVGPALLVVFGLVLVATSVSRRGAEETHSPDPAADVGHDRTDQPPATG